MKDNTFFLGVPYLFFIRRGLLGSTAIVDVYLCSHTHGGPGYIHGHVTRAYYGDALPQLGRIAQPHITQERGVDQCAVQIRAWDGHTDAFVRANGDEHGAKPIGKDIIQAVNLCVQAQLDAQIEDVLYLPLDDRCRQPILWYAYPQHAASDGKRLKDRHRVSHVAEILGGREPAGPRANHRHALLILALDGLRRDPRLGIDTVCYDPLECPDVDRLV